MTERVAPSGARVDSCPGGRRRRTYVLSVLGVVAGSLFGGTAWAAVNYNYQYGWLGPGGAPTDPSNNYRNYNDNSSITGHADSNKFVYYIWSSGNVTQSSAGSTKAHLGPSGNYTTSFPASQCQNN